MRGGKERLPWRDTDMQRWGDVCIMNGRIRDCRIPDPFAQNLIPSPFISYSGRATPRHVTASRVSNRRLRASHYRTYAQSTSETFGHLLIRRFNLFPSPQQHVCFTTKLFLLRPNPPRQHYSYTLFYYFARRGQQSYTFTHSIPTGRSACEKIQTPSASRL